MFMKSLWIYQDLNVYKSEGQCIPHNILTEIIWFILMIIISLKKCWTNGPVVGDLRRRYVI